MNFEEKCARLAASIDDIHDRQNLIDFAKHNIDEDRIFLAIHVLEALNTSSADYFNYDCNMGTLEAVTPIENDDDLNDIISQYDDEYIKEVLS